MRLYIYREETVELGEGGEALEGGNWGPPGAIQGEGGGEILVSKCGQEGEDMAGLNNNKLG